MNSPIQATLIADGSSDRALLPLLEHLLGAHSDREFVVQYADNLPSGPLGNRLQMALELYPCDIAFVHRDTEGQPMAHREAEIATAISRVKVVDSVRYISVIPVRMTEAWLLVDEAALRAASGNPNGRTSLNLPPTARLEQLADPKQVLLDALLAAKGIGARRRRAFDLHRARLRVPQHINDLAALRTVPSFQHLEEQVRNACSEIE